jgi:hypothetical protein
MDHPSVNSANDAVEESRFGTLRPEPPYRKCFQLPGFAASKIQESVMPSWLLRGEK